MRKVYLLLLSISFLFISSCSINGDGLPEEIDANLCAGQTPIVLAHGFLASGDTYEKQIQRFIANGVCKERIFTFDWNSFGAQNNVQRLNIFIKRILEETGEDQVFLAGHSAGSGLGYSLLNAANRAENVAKYVHLAGNPQNKPAGPEGNVPTLNIYSDADNAVTGGDIPGARNLNLIDKDHYEVATSIETFIEMYDFFYGELPSVVDLFDPSSLIEISGKILSFGENLPAVGAYLEVYELDEATGFRITPEPQFSRRALADGFWSPIEVKKGAYYEFLVYTGLPGDRPVHYYREPFTYPDPAVFIRSYPPLLSVGSIFLGGLPKTNQMSTVAFFGASQAAVNGRDVLKLNDVELSTANLASADQTLTFLHDNGDGVSTYKVLTLPFHF
ncbi:MAG: hypothetical protein R2753_06080 [Chitinophagales bacterium]